MDLMELADRCEKASGQDRELDELIAAEVVGATREVQSDGRVAYYRGGSWVSVGPVKEFTASIDAAMALVPEGMWGEGSLSSPAVIEVHDNVQYNERGKGHAATPALALCAAALRARVMAEANTTSPDCSGIEANAVSR